MKKVILEEIENMKYLLGYKRGVVISEQTSPVVNQDDDNSLNPKITNATQDMAAKIDSGNLTNLDPKAAEAIKLEQNAMGGQPTLLNTTSETTPPAAGATTPAVSTPATPIKIGMKYPSIEELQNSLNSKYQTGLTADGKYGPKTAASVLAALQKVPINNVETKTPENPVVGDASSEAIKKTAEANANVDKNTQVQGTNDDKQIVASGNNFSEVDFANL